MHMRRNMCETTAPSRVKNYSWETNRFLWGCSASVYSQIFCTQPVICYVVKTDFFSPSLSFFFFFCLLRGKINCERGLRICFHIGSVKNGCQNGGGQLWGKAGRPAAFCRSHALLHRVCDKTSLQEYWANTMSLSLGSTLFPDCTTAKTHHSPNTVSSFLLSKLNTRFHVESKNISSPSFFFSFSFWQKWFFFSFFGLRHLLKRNVSFFFVDKITFVKQTKKTQKGYFRNVTIWEIPDER